jgi:hypothetical protein
MGIRDSYGVGMMMTQLIEDQAAFLRREIVSLRSNWFSSFSFRNSSKKSTGKLAPFCS